MSDVVQAPHWLEQVSARWHEVLDDASLRDAPGKFETDRLGRLIATPHRNVDGSRRARIVCHLQRSLGGHAIPKCSIGTPDGVKVVDVAWCLDRFLSQHGFVDPYPSAPEICVELESPWNDETEMQQRIRLDLEAGAREVWLVDMQGGVRVFGSGGPASSSTFGIDTAVALHR